MEKNKPVFCHSSAAEWGGDGDRKIAVLMSGGVDSSVTAALLRQEGWNVLGVTMRIHEAEETGDPRFTSEEDVLRVCNQLEIPHCFIDAADYFRQNVVEPFKDAYFSGATPNPCVMCNPTMKFGVIRDCIRERFGVSRVATGHYARIIRDGNRAFLARGADRVRDQAYFLYRLGPDILPDIYFPLGGFRDKDETRRLAEAFGLPVAKRPDSMEICFIPNDDYRSFLGSGKASVPGNVIDHDGNVVGRHAGIENYTLGQRRGLGIAFGKPMYVVGIDPERNTVTVGNREQAYCKVVSAGQTTVLIPEELVAGNKLQGKIRSVGVPKSCRVTGCDNDRLEVEFLDPVFAPAPGQHLVLYDASDRVVAGGVIGG